MRRSRYQSGFTLIELIITASFIATAAAAIVSVFITIGNINRQARNLAIATQIAQQQAEIYRNLNYNSIAVSPPVNNFSSNLPANFGSPKSATATVTEPFIGLKRVDISIQYTENKRPKNVQLSTYISERGINR